jgi:hypothetical protein
VGGKRGENTETPQALAASAPQVTLSEQSDTVSGAPTESDAQADSKRAKRPRRGSRRRGERAENGSETDEASTDADDFDLKAPERVQEPLWKAPRLVPIASEIGFAPVDVPVDASYLSSESKIVIDGEKYDPYVFFVNSDSAENQDVVSRQIRLAAQAGVRIFSAVVYLPLKNAYGVRSFALIDSTIKLILDIVPDARILFRMQCAPTNFWVRTHPGELARYSNNSDGDVSFASAEFWRASVQAIGATIEYLAKPETFGASHVIGFHLDKGEWFHDSSAGYDYSLPNRRAFQHWLREKYQQVYALRAAWRDGSVDFDSAEIPAWQDQETSDKLIEPIIYLSAKDRRYVDYHAYASDIIAEAISGLSEAIKKISKNRLLSGASYGYTFDFSHKNDSGHQSLSRVLASPYVDFLAGPNSYQNRASGGVGANCGPIDSIRLHNKLWIVEDDTKTHLADVETPDVYNPKIVSAQDTLAVHRRNALAAAARNCGVNWMDLWGQGWLDSQEIWDDINQCSEIVKSAKKVLEIRQKKAPEVAVIIDEASEAYIRSNSIGIALQQGLITKTRDLFCRSGASVGFYLQSDIGLIPQETKLYVFLNAIRVTTAERQIIRDQLQKAGKTLAWIYAPGVFDEKGLSRQEVSEIVGLSLRPQPWNSKVGTLFTEERHSIIERLRGGKRMGSEEVVNPSYTSADPQGIVLGEYGQSGSPSVSARVMPSGWKTVFIGEPHLTGELIRGLYRYSDVHVFDSQDDVVVAGNGVLLIHAPYTGQRNISLPQAMAVYNATEKRLVSQSATSFRQFMRGRSSHFFLFGTLAELTRVLETTEEALLATIPPPPERTERNTSPDSRQRNHGSRPASVEEPPLSDIEIVTNVIEGAELPEYAEYLPSEDEALGDIEQIEKEGATLPATPSRRRRWNRRKQRTERSDPSTPVSIESILEDLPPRRKTERGFPTNRIGSI